MQRKTLRTTSGEGVESENLTCTNFNRLYDWGRAGRLFRSELLELYAGAGTMT